jgi:hypothetical protein
MIQLRKNVLSIISCVLSHAPAAALDICHHVSHREWNAGFCFN